MTPTNRPDYLPINLFLLMTIGLVPAAVAYHELVPLLTGQSGSFELLWSSIWRGTLFEHDVVAHRIERTWPILIANGYAWFFTGAALVPVLIAGGCLALSRRAPRTPIYGLAGYVVGAALAWIITRFADLSVFWGLLALPIGSIVAGYVTLLFTAPPLPEREVAIRRGTRIIPLGNIDTVKAVESATRRSAVCLVGRQLPTQAETRSILMLGASGTGKSVAISAMMNSIGARGDRMIVADPDGAAMSRFWQSGDVILNPLDGRGASWDLLAEIEQDTDYKHLAESILPYTGDTRIDEWRTHSQTIFAACLRTWRENQLGTSEEFIRTITRADESKLGLLCQGTVAQRYFSGEGQKMLSSILNTLTPSLADMEALAYGNGELFSVRRWVREGTGTLWIPYGAGQIASLRGPISCWMRLGIFELLSMPDSQKRRMWFFLDEMDALGRIQGLKDAMVRSRKKGGCIVAGIQSIGQIEYVYGQEAQTIVEQFATTLILRCGASDKGGTAEFASRLIGKREIQRLETTQSSHAGQDGSSTTTSIRTQLEDAVLATEIVNLPDLTGYVHIAGKPEWFSLSYSAVDRPQVTNPSVPIAAPVATVDTLETVGAETEGEANSPPSPEDALLETALLYAAQHPRWPDNPGSTALNRAAGGYQGASSIKQYVIWPAFWNWWTNAPEEERYPKVKEALVAKGLLAKGDVELPEHLWDAMNTADVLNSTAPVFRQLFAT